MTATHSLSKPLYVFTSQAHKPTILNLHPNNVTILSSSISGGNCRMLRQEMRLRDHLQPTETMGLSRPDPEVVATKRPITRICMCQNKKVPSRRSVTLGFLRGGTAPSEVLSVANGAPLDPQLLVQEFKGILLKDMVDFRELQECAWRMEMSRQEDAAVIELLWYIVRCIGSEEIHNAKLLLVEMLIYQGDYERARQTWEKATQNLEKPTEDYRLQFYPAVIYVLLGKEDEAKKHWDALDKMSKEGFGSVPPNVDDDGQAENQLGASPARDPWAAFKDHVKVLGQEITAVRYCN